MTRANTRIAVACILVAVASLLLVADPVARGIVALWAGEVVHRG